MKMETGGEFKAFKSLARKWDVYLDEYFRNWGREVTREVADTRNETPARSRAYRTREGMIVEIEGSPSEIDAVEDMFEGHKPFPTRARIEDNPPMESFLRRNRR